MIPKNQSVLLRYLIRCFCDISIGVFELITNHLVLQVASAGARVVAADSCDTYTVSLWRHPDRGPTSGSQASNNPLPFHREHLNGIQIFSIRIHIQAFLPRHEHLRPHPKDSIQFLKAKVRESFGRYCNCFAHNNFRRYGFEGEYPMHYALNNPFQTLPRLEYLTDCRHHQLNNQPPRFPRKIAINKLRFPRKQSIFRTYILGFPAYYFAHILYVYFA